LPDELGHTLPLIKYEFVEGEKCFLEEDLTHEFKEVKGANPVKSIQNLVDEYILACFKGQLSDHTADLNFYIPMALWGTKRVRFLTLIKHFRAIEYINYRLFFKYSNYKMSFLITCPSS